jgi:UDP-glucose 4-epimerase
MNDSKYILVTGGAGYIGSHTVVELYENGFTPVIVDDFRNSHYSVIEGLEKITKTDIIYRKIDVCNFNAFENIFIEFSFVGIIHFAAYKAVGESVLEPIKYYRNNLDGLLNCLELAQIYKVHNIVFSSSCTVYGEPKGVNVVTENTSVQPANSPYGNTKQIGEEIINDVINSGAELKILKLRYFNPIGAHDTGLIGELPIGKPNNLLPYVTQTAIGTLQKLIVFGNDYATHDGTCVRDYVHVCDVANAHVKGLEWLMKQNPNMTDTVNIGTGKGTSVLEIIHIFEKISERQLNWEFGNRREGDVPEIYADVTKAEQLLDWKAKRNVKDAIFDAWTWELKRNND